PIAQENVRPSALSPQSWQRAIIRFFTRPAMSSNMSGCALAEPRLRVEESRIVTMKRIVSLLFLLAAASASAADGTLQFANLGDFKLDSGQIVRHCRIGYRTYGQLTEDRSNVIVALTWFGGSTQGLAAWIGPSKLYDSSKFFVVAIDALGDGVSSSPSNNAGMPPFTIRDMVHTQHEVL